MAVPAPNFRPFAAEGATSGRLTGEERPAAVGEIALLPHSRRFCLITCGNVSNRPRLIKEADALVEAGHRVAVIAIDIDPRIAARDEAMIAGRHWQLQPVTLRRGTAAGAFARAAARGVQSIVRTACRMGVRSPDVEDRALNRYLPHFVRRGRAQQADVVIGHGLEALPVAARVARILGARLGFDSEDLHVGELLPDGRDQAQIELVRAVEGRYLRRCSYLTAASDGIADALVEAYGVARPVVILNTFERCDTRCREAGRSAGCTGPTLYWFSQVIGPGRGIEDAVTALASLPDGVGLHLRGQSDPGFVEFLRARASSLGIAKRLFFWPDVEPEALIPLAMEHDIGLALEHRVPRNRDLCVTNKLFAYLTAGLAVAASDTSGQRAVLQRIPGAGFLFPPGDSAALAAGLRPLVEHPEILARAKRAAAEAASGEFSWSRDAVRLVQYLSGPGVRLCP